MILLPLPISSSFSSPLLTPFPAALSPHSAIGLSRQEMLQLHPSTLLILILVFPSSLSLSVMPYQITL